MGYSYGVGGLVCDQCGQTGNGTRKRHCPFTVTCDRGFKMHYCPAPAVCSSCLKELGGTRKMHASFGCEEGARLSQEKYDAVRARTEAGEHRVDSAYGSWADWVPQGMVGVSVRGGGRYLVDKDEYDARSVDPFIEDFPSRRQFENDDVPEEVPA
jgi:hypothetical protein